MKRTMLAAWFLSAFIHILPAWACGERPPPPQDAPDRNAQGLWWAAPAGSESGWGLNITHQDHSLFITWFTYDSEGRAVWFVVTGTHRRRLSQGTFTNIHEGTLYSATGSPFDGPWDSSQVRLTAVGGVYLWLDSGNIGTFQYWFWTNGSAPTPGTGETRRITRYVFASPAPTCYTDGEQGSDTLPPNYTDMWWSSPAGSESGWGVNVAHQGDTLFATWFTFGRDGKSDWLVMSNGERQLDGSYAGALYRMRGPAYSARPWNGSQVKAMAVGRASILFSDNENGVFSYALDGIAQSKPITRYVYATPVTVCR